ncbi:hypothetical protein LJR066_005829 [Acidovorax sp. LjRoot66]|uniref:hypothetical protein n=1 Tax=Acidovorax sp. LjRoot66 TaxID=3342334 RepID=UPI003ECE1F92
MMQLGRRLYPVASYEDPGWQGATIGHEFSLFLEQLTFWQARMTYVLFANLVRDTTGGWLDMVTRGTLEQCIAAGHTITADWAHIVDLHSGAIIRSKTRKFGDPDLQHVSWLIGESEVDKPESLCMLLSRKEAGKLALLGGEHWIRDQLTTARMPVPLPLANSSMEFLHALEGHEFPFFVVGEAARWVQQLRDEGLVNAKCTAAEDPEPDWAVIRGLTERGRRALTSKVLRSTQIEPTQRRAGESRETK